MPTIHRVRNIRIVIFTRDHPPAHVHVIGPDFELRLFLGSWETEVVRGKPARLDDAVAWVKDNEARLRAAWHNLTGSEP